MSRVAINTPIAGATEGNFVDDLTSPDLGQWPRTQVIQRITNITVLAGSIIDSVSITYQVPSSGPIGEQIGSIHGGPGGTQVLNSQLSASEKLVAVYGLRHTQAGPYGSRNIVQLSFVVVDSSGNAPTVRVLTAAGTSTDPTEKFELSWPLEAASSFTAQPQGATSSYLQGLGFSKALGSAGLVAI